MVAIRALVSVKTEVFSTAIKDLIDIPRNRFADKFGMFFVESLPVVVILKDVFNGYIAGD